MIAVQIVEHGRTTTVTIRPGQPVVTRPVRPLAAVRPLSAPQPPRPDEVSGVAA